MAAWPRGVVSGSRVERLTGARVWAQHSYTQCFFYVNRSIMEGVGTPGAQTQGRGASAAGSSFCTSATLTHRRERPLYGAVDADAGLASCSSS